MSESAEGVLLENRESTVLKQGDYGKVSLVSEVSLSAEQAIQTQKNSLVSKVKGWWSPKHAIYNEAVNVVNVAADMIDKHKIAESEVKKFPTGLSPKESLRLANIFGGIIKYNDEQSLRMRREFRFTKPYDLGLVLSDFLQVIPPAVAAKVLFVASDPNISRSLLQGEGTLNLQGVDMQPYAVEAVVLLPKEARHEIFSEMVKLQPGREGRAHRLFSLIAANWTQRNSDYCGSKLIYANLQGERASEKVLEVQADLAELGPLIRGEQSQKAA